MKTAIKILTALAAIAGVIYVIAAYGDEIVAWARKIVKKCPVIIETPDVEDVTIEEVPEEPQEESAEEETVADETVAVEDDFAVEEPAEPAAAAEEAVVDETAPVASEEDFEA